MYSFSLISKLIIQFYNFCHLKIFPLKNRKNRTKLKNQQIYRPFFNTFFFVAGVDEVSAHANSASSLTLEDPAEAKAIESLRYLKSNSLQCLGTGTF